MDAGKVLTSSCLRPVNSEVVRCTSSTKTSKLMDALQQVRAFRMRLSSLLDSIIQPGGQTNILQGQIKDEEGFSLFKLLSDGPAILNACVGECEELIESININLCIISKKTDTKKDESGILGNLTSFYDAIDRLDGLNKELQDLVDIICVPTKDDDCVATEPASPRSLEALMESGADNIGEIVEQCNRHIETITAKLF